VRVISLIIVFILATVAPSYAQERPFLFSIATVEESKPAVRFDYDVSASVNVPFGAMFRISRSNALDFRPRTVG
jgi:hypothetical protein